MNAETQEIEQALVQDIKECFSPKVRDGLSIGPAVSLTNGNIRSIRVRIPLKPGQNLYSPDKLMELLGDSEIHVTDSESKITGKYERSPCEITIQHPPTDS